MAQEKSVLAKFWAGETRTVFARRRDGTPGLHYLADGAAVDEREWTRAQLLCTVEGCPTPGSTSVNNGDR